MPIFKAFLASPGIIAQYSLGFVPVIAFDKIVLLRLIIGAHTN
tara:strand:- start:441 stop:569 length:129 start_codon:yes stop_codon:yes gene_type:complete